MHKRHFEFRPDSWCSPESYEFAELLVLADKIARKEICDSFGLGISVSDSGLQTFWDGTKFGLGSFTTPALDVTFEVFPKVETFEVRALFDALDSIGSPTIRIGERGPTQISASKDDNFAVPFLIDLCRM